MICFRCFIYIIIYLNCFTCQVFWLLVIDIVASTNGARSPRDKEGRLDSADSALTSGKIHFHSILDNQDDSGRDTVTPVDGQRRDSQVDKPFGESSTDSEPGDTTPLNVAIAPKSKMSHSSYSPAGDEEEEDLPVGENGEAIPLEEKRPKGEMFNMISNAQAGVVQIGSLITNPSLKRVESSEVLNLTLHQVGDFRFCSFLNTCIMY